MAEPQHESELQTHLRKSWDKGLSEARVNLIYLSQRMPNASPLDRLRHHLRNKTEITIGHKRSRPFEGDDDGLDYDALKPTEWFTLQ